MTPEIEEAFEGYKSLALTDKPKPGGPFVYSAPNVLIFVTEAERKAFTAGYQAALPEWQDISTAPKNGTYFLISHKHSKYTVRCRWCERVGAWETDEDMLEDHQSQWANVVDFKSVWQPLPSPPKDNES